MAKRLLAKTGEYTNNNNETKGEYTRLGVIMQGDNGEYMLLDPTVSLAGVLAKQNTFAMSQNKPVRDSVMVSVFEDSNQNQQQGNGYQQQQQMNQRQPNPQNRGFQGQQTGQQGGYNSDPAF